MAEVEEKVTAPTDDSGAVQDSSLNALGNGDGGREGWKIRWLARLLPVLGHQRLFRRFLARRLKIEVLLRLQRTYDELITQVRVADGQRLDSAAARLALANEHLLALRGLLEIRDESWPTAILPGRGRDGPRWEYQEHWVPLNVPPGASFLDIGSGNDPHPRATCLADRYDADNHHRGGSGVGLVRDGRPLVYCDLERLPFGDGAFEYVYCSHVLEHVEDPVRACAELVRVGRRGYIETPTRLSDIMFNFTRLRHHKWHVAAVAGTLVFLQYMEHEQRDTGTSAFYMQFQSPIASAFQELVHRNRDLFENMFPWVGGLRLMVIDRCGELIANETIGTPRAAPAVRRGPFSDA